MGWARDAVADLSQEDKDSQHTVSFSETPLAQVHCLCSEISGRSVCLLPYGIAITKMTARKMGCNPVLYVDMTPGRTWILAQALDRLREEAVESRDFREHPASKVFPYVEPMGTWNDRQREFWWEREWRHQGDVQFDLSDIALVLAPEADHESLTGLLAAERGDDDRLPRCIDAGWSLERIIAHLASVPPDQVTPFLPR